MYFERWGLLAPPSGKRASLKDMSALLPHMSTIPQPVTSVQRLAYGRAGVQETDSLLTRQGQFLSIILNISMIAQ
jgi:hypothetical protein